jgi:hypothetical protein
MNYSYIIIALAFYVYPDDAGEIGTVFQKFVTPY